MRSSALCTTSPVESRSSPDRTRGIGLAIAGGYLAADADAESGPPFERTLVDGLEVEIVNAVEPVEVTAAGTVELTVQLTNTGDREVRRHDVEEARCVSSGAMEGRSRLSTFADKPTLTGDLVVLRPVDEDDYPALAAAMADPEVMKFTGDRGDDPLDEAQIRRWYRTRKDQADRLDLAIVDRASRTVVGEAVLNKWSPADRSCNFRILIGPEGRNRRLGTEATRLTVGYGFESLGLHRIELTVFAFNPRAQRAYEKAGFVVEGRRRQALYWEGEWVDDLLMAILAPDWKALERSERPLPEDR